jgi:hypothetical protein
MTSTVRLPNHPPLDPELPLQLRLVAANPPARDLGQRVQAVADLFLRFVRMGAFPEARADTTARASLVGNVVQIDLERLPADQATLGVLGRMLLHAPGGWAEVQVQGSAPRRPGRALEPLPSSLRWVPRLRQPLVVGAQIDPGIGWYSIELRQRAGWREQELTALQSCADVWLQVCRAGGLGEVPEDAVAIDGTATLEIVGGNVGMDPPQVGDDFWAAQIGATDIHLGAVSALVNVFDQAARTGTPIEELTVT